MSRDRLNTARRHRRVCRDLLAPLITVGSLTYTVTMANNCRLKEAHVRRTSASFSRTALFPLEKKPTNSASFRIGNVFHTVTNPTLRERRLASLHCTFLRNICSNYTITDCQYGRSVPAEFLTTGGWLIVSVEYVCV